CERTTKGFGEVTDRGPTENTLLVFGCHERGDPPRRGRDERDAVFDAFRDRVRRVVEEGRHHCQRAGSAEFLERGLTLQVRLDSDRGAEVVKGGDDALGGPAFALASEEEQLVSVRQLGCQAVQCCEIDPDALSFAKLAEERQPPDWGPVRGARWHLV